MKFAVPMLVFVGIAGRLSVIPNALLVLVLLAYSLHTIVRVLGRDIPILEVTGFVYVLQILVGAVVSYAYPPDFSRYVMAVNAETYFSYAIPAVCAYLIPIAFVRNQLPFLTQIMGFQAGRKVFSAGLLICAFGFAVGILSPYVPASLRFVAFLLSELKYVGALYCYFCRHGQRRWVLISVFGATAVSSLAAAMFHQLLLWGSIVFSLVIYREVKRNTVWLRLGCVAVGVFAVIGLQSYKDEYRAERSQNSQAGILANLRNALTEGTMNLDSSISVLRVRLNQGWIITNVLRNVPAYEPYAGGETLLEAVQDSFLPRFLFKKAARGGGRDNFRKYTGLQISDTTSMGISPVGEAYANLGVNGGIVVMFFYGTFLSGLYYFLTTRKTFDALWLLWIPAIFSQAIKSETELSVVLNHLVKASILSVCVYLVLHKLMFGRTKAPLEASRRRTRVRHQLQTRAAER